ncbi:MAG: hypothetical protein C0615_06250 [Desulfuromonas sp.]|nr:MAG: hypothetical protein C0615_06250 [Desulfuromonas sp.]
MKNVLLVLFVALVSSLFILSNSAMASSGKYLKMLDSGDVKTRIQAAKMVARDKAFDAAILQKIESKLRAGYNKRANDRYHNDEMAYYCKTLSATGDMKYKKLLEEVASGTSNRNLKRHAGNSLKLLADNAELKQIKSAKGDWDSSLSDSENKQMAMLRSDQFRLKRTAAKELYGNPGANVKVFDEVANQLLAGTKEMSRDRDYVDTMAWLCKALGNSGQAKYKETLLKAKAQTSNANLKKYADQALRML